MKEYIASGLPCNKIINIFSIKVYSYDLLEGLPENYRAVLILSDLEEMTNQEIAEVLDISLEAVKIRLHRARVRLKKELEHNCSFYRDDRNELACDLKVSSLRFLSTATPICAFKEAQFFASWRIKPAGISDYFRSPGVKWVRC